MWCWSIRKKNAWITGIASGINWNEFGLTKGRYHGPVRWDRRWWGRHLSATSWRLHWTPNRSSSARSTRDLWPVSRRVPLVPLTSASFSSAPDAGTVPHSTMMTSAGRPSFPFHPQFLLLLLLLLERCSKEPTKRGRWRRRTAVKVPRFKVSVSFACRQGGGRGPLARANLHMQMKFVHN